MPDDCRGRFEPNADGAALIDKGTLGENSPDDILGRHIGAIQPPPLEGSGPDSGLNVDSILRRWRECFYIMMDVEENFDAYTC